MPANFLMPLAQIQPSQLYISEQKLARIAHWWQPPTLENLEPVPIKRLNGRIIFTDGHTRAFAVYQQGFTTLPVFWDEDDLDWEAYQICVDWCLEEDIRTVMDLDSRIISADVYDLLWLGRCREMQLALEAQRQR